MVTVHSCRKLPAYERAGYGPHWDPLSLREARSGTNAVKYTAISTGGLQGIPMRTIPCPLIRCFIGSVRTVTNGKFIVNVCSHSLDIRI